jgi:hypothetical protein
MVSPMRNLPLNLTLAALLCFSAAASAFSQDRYFPLDHREPVGKNAHWNVLARPDIFGYPQPVRISIPGAGRVTFFDGTSPAGVTVDAPGQANLLCGYAYRVRISDMPDFPGVELWPTIEVVDRLHPPSNLVDEYPIPIEITAEEIAAVAQDRMVTKVIYLERQDLPRPGNVLPEPEITDLLPNANLIEDATLRGRPVAILRLGGRTPAPNAPDDLRLPVAPVQVKVPTPSEP